MAATTISRATWTDGVSGTLINNARLQADVYDKIDSLISSAITFGSTVSAEGFGTHSFSASGTGSQILLVRNTSAGTGNAASVRLGNDASAAGGLLQINASTFTPSGANAANGVSLTAALAGGLSLAATDASGTIKFYTGGSTERMRITAAGLVGMGVTPSTFRLEVSSTSDFGIQASNTTATATSRIYATCGTASGGLQQAGQSHATDANLLTVFSPGAIALQVNGSVRASVNSSGHFVPGLDDTYDLGSTTLAWQRLFLDNGSAAAPALTAGDDSDTGIYFDGSGKVAVASDGGTYFEVTTAGARVYGNLTITGGTSISEGVLPATDDLYDLGGVSDRWDDVYATNGTIQTSDRNLKTDIAALPLGLTFLRGLRPVQYRWNREGRKGTGRLHAGLIAQEVLAAAPDVTAYGLITGDGSPANRYGLRYTELIAPLVAAVQELAARVEALESR